MSAPAPRARNILVTGADGFLGRGVVAALARRPDTGTVVALDVREVPPERRQPGVTYQAQDVRDKALTDTLQRHAIDTVVHLASIVTPGRDSNRAFEYDVDVNGTRNVLQACADQGVRHVLVSSSGAAYGYHADNAPWLTESHPLLHALDGAAPGCYNLAGDGALSIHQIAARLGKRTLDLPAWLLQSALFVGSRLGVSRYGPEQLDFLRYRPVLLNTALKEQLGYVPRKTSAQAFDAFVAARQQQGRPVAVANVLAGGRA